jgi:hypothetical protein
MWADVAGLPTLCHTRSKMSKLKIAVGLAISTVLLASCADSDSEDFDVVLVQLQKASAEDPFSGTASVVLQFEYGDCLTTFYRQEHTEYAQDGIEGEDVFNEWADRICDDGEFFADKTMVGCEVESIDQTFSDATDMNFLRVEYNIFETSMDLKHLAFGPLPNEEFAGCNPTVRLSVGGVQGFAENGVLLWSLQSFSNMGNAAAGQGAAVQVTVGP